MTAENALPSQVTQAPGSQDLASFAPQNFEITSEHLSALADWHHAVYPGREPPLDRQAGQFRKELIEVGDEVFGLDTDELAALPLENRQRIGSEITDVIIAGYGVIKALGYDYSELRVIHETDVYDASLLSELQRWQVDANGENVPVKIRLSDFGMKAMRVHRAYDELGTEDIGLISDVSKKDIASQMAEVMTSGLSVMNGIGVSFDERFKLAYAVMRKKYDPGLLEELRAKGMTDTQAMEEAKRMYLLDEPVKIFEPQAAVA